MKRLKFFAIFLRSLLLQSVWNFERMQNVGFLFAIHPAFKKIYPDKDRRLEALKAHNVFFNTHPYMANVIIGLIAALEEEKTSGVITGDEIQTFKSNISGPLAAIGDTFFWATWRPFCALILVSVMLIYGRFMTPPAALAFLGAYLLVYNSLHFTVRYTGLVRAYELKTKIIGTITKMNTQKLTDVIRLAGTVIILSTAILYFTLNLAGTPSRLSFAAVFVMAAVFTKNGVSSTRLFYLTMVTAFALSMAVLLGGNF